MVRIVRAEEEDLADVCSLLEGCGLPVEGLAAHLDTTLVARRDGVRIVGSAALEMHDEAALLRSVAVAPGFRGEGLGRRLVAAALELAGRRKAKRAYLLTEGAERFFAELGFGPIPHSLVKREAPGVAGSVEFVSACPKSARAMALTLNPDHRLGS